MTFAEYVRSFAPQWWRITLLGEPTMMIPVAVVIFVWLWASCSRRTALVWGGLLGVGGGLLIAQKLLYYMAGISFDSIRLYTLSGHSVAASYIYGSLVAILCASWPRALRYVAWSLVALLVLAIGVSRVAVAGHRVSEAVVGLGLGTLLLGGFLRMAWRQAKARYAAWTLALPALIVIVAMYGRVFEFERIFRSLGRWARPGATFYR